MIVLRTTACDKNKKPLSVKDDGFFDGLTNSPRTKKPS